MRKETLCFLVKRKEDGTISELCLAMKKRGFGEGKWNGAGGKLEKGETVMEATIRETQEEIGVTPISLLKVAELTFLFDSNPSWNSIGYIYLCDKWKGEISESEEMAPKWFKNDESILPFAQMWEADQHWLPRVLKGEFLTGEFLFEGDKVLNFKLMAVEEEELLSD